MINVLHAHLSQKSIKMLRFERRIAIRLQSCKEGPQPPLLCSTLRSMSLSFSPVHKPACGGQVPVVISLTNHKKEGLCPPPHKIRATSPSLCQTAPSPAVYCLQLTSCSRATHHTLFTNSTLLLP